MTIDGLTPQATYLALLLVQTLHLLHHRLARRHIRFAEVLSSATLLLHPSAFPAVPGALFMTAHALLIAVQVVGSLWIRRLSPSGQ
jgi:hypothetical protein